MSDPYCNLCGDLVDDDPDEYMVDGRCLDCDKAFQAGRKSVTPVLSRICDHRVASAHDPGGASTMLEVVEGIEKMARDAWKDIGYE